MLSLSMPKISRRCSMKKSDGIGAMPATAGISLVIGLLASTFGSKSGGGNNALQEATDAFLDNLKQSLEAFENEVLTSMEKFEQAKASGDDALSGLEDVIYALNQVAAWMQALQSLLIESATEVQSAIEDRYDLEMDLINDVGRPVLPEREGRARHDPARLGAGAQKSHARLVEEARQGWFQIGHVKDGSWTK
jgi:hypothetical protein